MEERVPQSPTPTGIAPPTTPSTAPISPRSTLFEAASLDGWLSSEGLKHKGLVVRRRFDGSFSKLDREIDEARGRFGRDQCLLAQVANSPSDQQLAARLRSSVGTILAAAALPAELSAQVEADACAMGCAVGALCPASSTLEIKLEIFGDNTCSRWHFDSFVGRAIVSYTGTVGTEYTADANLDFYEMRHCGKNECIIREPLKVETVGVGDFLFIKGSTIPTAEYK